MNGNEIMLYLAADNADLKAKLRDTERQLERFQKSGEKTSGNVVASFQRMYQAAKIYLSIQGVKALLGFAGEVDTVSKTFKNLAASAENGSSGLLEAMRKASRGTIAELDIMKSSNLALQLMGEDVAKMLPEMAEIATKTARAQGVSAAQMLNDIVVASGRQSVMILDNLGISSVTAGQYMEEYAARLGKTRLQLSDTEKRAAFFYATMKAGGEIAKKSGDDALTFGEVIQKLKAALIDFAAWATEKITPALNGIGNAIAWATDQARELERELTKGNQQIERFSTQGTGGYIERSKFKYDKEWQYKEVDAAGNVVRMWTAAADQVSKQKQRISTTPQSPTAVSAGKSTEASLADFYSYTGQMREAEIVKEQEHIQQLLAATNLSTEQKKAAYEAYNKHREEIDLKYNTAYQLMMQSQIQAFKSFSSAVDTANAELVYNLMWGKGGWKQFEKALGGIFKQLLADIAYAIMRALVLQSILGATGGGGLVSGLVSSIFQEGHIPQFQKGRIPAYPTGYIPMDHHLAYIGTKEAVVRADSTRANIDLLRWMNNNPGQSASQGGGVFSFTIPVTIDGREVGRAVDTYRDETARNSGLNNYHRRSNYR